MLNISMRINEITMPTDIDSAGRRLYRAGYDNIASKPGHTGGTYGDIFWRADLPYVVKLFQPNDEAYLRYLNLITSKSNPHFPQVRGRPIRLDRYYAVRLERLTPLQGREADNKRYWMEEVLQYLQAGNVAAAKIPAQSLSHTELQALVMIYNHCIKQYPGTIVDLHKFNVMMRGNNTLVIIDPIANPDSDYR